MDEPALRVFGALPAKLHQGERACLSIAHQGDWLVLTDDRAARVEAQRRSIAISGSIGCLVLSVERGHTSLDQANRWKPQSERAPPAAPVVVARALTQAVRCNAWRDITPFVVFGPLRVFRDPDLARRLPPH